MLVFKFCGARGAGVLAAIAPRRTQHAMLSAVPNNDPHNKSNTNNNNNNTTLIKRTTSYSNFPDFIEWWHRKHFYQVGYGLAALSAVSMGLSLSGTGAVTLAWSHPVTYLPAFTVAGLTAAYWIIGLDDMKQTNHAVLRNYPVLGNIRFIFEVIRPEIRQYFVESDDEGKPFDRMHRSQIYQRG
jgi:hypothetical protein